MLISDRNKVIFVHIQKTGGNTISRLLRKTCPDVRPFKAKHAFASEGMHEIAEWDQYYKFAFVRNPWDRLVSWYRMIRDAGNLRWYQALNSTRNWSHYRQARGNKLWCYALESSSTFTEFINNCIDAVPMGKSEYSFAFNQLDYVTDPSGKLVVDFVGKFENFETDLRKVFGELRIELNRVPHLNRSGQDVHYSSYYTTETEGVVRNRFLKDIEFFGYEFEKRR